MFIKRCFLIYIHIVGELKQTNSKSLTYDNPFWGKNIEKLCS